MGQVSYPMYTPLHHIRNNVWYISFSDLRVARRPVQVEEWLLPVPLTTGWQCTSYDGEHFQTCKKRVKAISKQLVQPAVQVVGWLLPVLTAPLIDFLKFTAVSPAQHLHLFLLLLVIKMTRTSQEEKLGQRRFMKRNQDLVHGRLAFTSLRG